MEYLKLTWADIEEQCRALAKEIEEQSVPFDVIIGISRGGWVPARLLSDLLDNDEIDTVRVKFYKSVGETANEPRVLLSTQIDIEDKDVLLVDDIADTGGSLAATVEHIKGKGPDWVIFPWEVNETKRNLEAKSDSQDDLQKELEKAGLLL
jgi:hypoxanthine phosphoribosyltransferase